MPAPVYRIHAWVANQNPHQGEWVLMSHELPPHQPGMRYYVAEENAVWRGTDPEGTIATGVAHDTPMQAREEVARLLQSYEQKVAFDAQPGAPGLETAGPSIDRAAELDRLHAASQPDDNQFISGESLNDYRDAGALEQRAPAREEFENLGKLPHLYEDNLKEIVSVWDAEGHSDRPERTPIYAEKPETIERINTLCQAAKHAPDAPFRQVGEERFFEGDPVQFTGDYPGYKQGERGLVVGLVDGKEAMHVRHEEDKLSTVLLGGEEAPPCHLAYASSVEQLPTIDLSKESFIVHEGSPENFAQECTAYREQLSREPHAGARVFQLESMQQQEITPQNRADIAHDQSPSVDQQPSQQQEMSLTPKITL